MNEPTLLLWCGGISALLFALIALGALWLLAGIKRASRTHDEPDHVIPPPPASAPPPDTSPDTSDVDGDYASTDVLLWDGDVVLLEVDEAVGLADLRAHWEAVPAEQH